MATGPVSDERSGVRFTLEALLSDGKSTTVKFNVTGLPGGKEGWEKAERVGDGPPERGLDQRRSAPSRMPYLQDEAGHRYDVQWSQHGVGGSPQENRIEGQMSFAPLPAELCGASIWSCRWTIWSRPASSRTRTSRSGCCVYRWPPRPRAICPGLPLRERRPQTRRHAASGRQHRRARPDRRAAEGRCDRIRGDDVGRRERGQSIQRGDLDRRPGAGLRIEYGWLAQPR